MIIIHCSQRVNEAEEKLRGTLSDGQKIKIFHKKGGDIKVEAKEIAEGWELIDQNIQVGKLVALIRIPVISTFVFQYENWI